MAAGVGQGGAEMMTLDGKPVVVYRDLAAEWCTPVVGRSIYLVGVEKHPRGLRGDLVLTSPVRRYDPETGQIETENTVYIKKEANA